MHPSIIDAGHIGGAIATGVDGTVARSVGRTLTVVSHVEVALHGPNTVVAVAAIKMVQDVEVAVLALGNENVELEVVVTILFVTEEEDLVVAIGEVTALCAFVFGNNAVFTATGSVAPSSPPVVTGSNSFNSDLVAHGVLLERIED